MEWTISHIVESGITLVETSGELTPQHLNQMIVEARKEQEIYNSKLVLVDHRKAGVAMMRCTDAYDRPKEMEKLGAPRNMRTALVCAEKDMEKFRFMESVSVNRGYQLRIFTDIELAKKWLTG
jgi:predicted metal-dependent peptidase